MVTLFFVVVDMRSWPRLMPRSDAVQRCSAAACRSSSMASGKRRIRRPAPFAAVMRGDYVLAMSSFERRFLHRCGRL